MIQSNIVLQTSITWRSGWLHIYCEQNGNPEYMLPVLKKTKLDDLVAAANYGIRKITPDGKVIVYKEKGYERVENLKMRDEPDLYSVEDGYPLEFVYVYNHKGKCWKCWDIKNQKFL